MRRLAFAVPALGLLACAPVTLTPGAEAVRVTASQDAIRGCTSKGILSAKDRQGGALNQGRSERNVDRRLRNDAAAKGANVLLLIDSKSGINGASGKAEAFHCADVR